MQQSVVPDRVLDASGALSVASDKFGTLSVVPILDACSTLIVVPDKFDALSVVSSLYMAF